MKLYIIRHGETKLNALGRLQGWTDEPLNQNGKDLAIITGEALKEIPFDLVITSPLILKFLILIIIYSIQMPFIIRVHPMEKVLLM